MQGEIPMDELGPLRVRVAHLEQEARYQIDRYKGMVADRDDWRARADRAQDAEGWLASTGDLLNSWARESGIEEANSPKEVRLLADRLWSHWSTKYFAIVKERDEANALLLNPVAKTGDFETDVRADYYNANGDADGWSKDFETWLVDYGVPEKYVGGVARKAYSDGHAYGYYEILNCAYGLIEIFTEGK